MNTILYAHTGSGNHGCEALVRSTAELLNCKPILFSTGYEEDIKYGIAEITNLYQDAIISVPRRSAAYVAAALQTKITKSTTMFTGFSHKGLLDHIHKGDVCLSIGGDNYCYAGAEFLRDLNILLKKRGAKTVLWGCSIDPEMITSTMVSDLNRYDLITVRDPLTKTALKKAGVEENVRSVADPAFILGMQETELPEGFLPGNTIGINLSPLVLRRAVSQDDVIISFKKLIQHILDTSDSAILLIPHVTKKYDSDLEVLSRIYEWFKYTGRVLLATDGNCMQLKYIISQCRLFVGARTHATIAAYSTYVPTLVIGYSVKSRGIATDLFGTDHNYVLPIQRIDSENDLIVAYDWLEANAAAMSMRLRNVIPEYQEKARLGKKYLDEIANNP